MKILGISAFYHDSAAAIIHDGKIIAAAQEERFSRKKHDPSFPSNAIKFCLQYSGASINQLDAVVFYDKPLLKFERLLETYYSFSPKGINSFIKSMPIWLSDKIFIKRIIRRELYKIEPYDKKNLKLLFTEHHLSHAASAFYPSGYKKAAILTIDGVGEWATASICYGDQNNITLIKELHFPHSIGLLYSSFTYFLGFKVNSGEYKLMGLAPYGNHGSDSISKFINLIKSNLVDIKEDGSIWLNQEYFDFATGLKMINEKKWEHLFGFKRRSDEMPLAQHHCDLALSIQLITEEIVLNLAKEAKILTGASHLCLAGGVALNCVANGKIQKAQLFESIFIQPAAGDAGGSLGAALAAYHIYFSKQTVSNSDLDGMSGSYLGPEYSPIEIMQMARRYDAPLTEYKDYHELCKIVANLLSKGKVVGWMNGRMEFGPRALGNRSILGDPRDSEMQKKLNLKIKYRESFRPFAPSVLAEDYSDFFNQSKPSPYMLMVHDLMPIRREALPANYNNISMREKLYTKRSDLPAITHVDFSARIQTVHKETNPIFHELLSCFKQLSGIGMLVNTSFNVRGEPIVCSPDEAYKCFMRTEMDYLVINNFLFDKTSQTKLQFDDNWKEEFVLD